MAHEHGRDNGLPEPDDVGQEESTVGFHAVVTELDGVSLIAERAVVLGHVILDLAVELGVEIRSEAYLERLDVKFVGGKRLRERFFLLLLPLLPLPVHLLADGGGLHDLLEERRSPIFRLLPHFIEPIDMPLYPYLFIVSADSTADRLEIIQFCIA